MTCPRCQQMVAPVDLFCGYCGARIGGPVAAVAGRPANQSAAAPAGTARRAGVGIAVVETPAGGAPEGAAGHRVEVEPAAAAGRALEDVPPDVAPATGGEPGAEPFATPAGARSAGFLVRGAAFLVDAGLLAAWSGIVLVLVLWQMMAAGVVAPLRSPDDIPTPDLLAMARWGIAPWSAIVVAYLVCFVAIEGATPGKMLLGLRVIRPDASRPSWGRAALREVAGKALSAVTIGIGYLMIAFGAKRGLHDLVAGTLVVRVPDRA